MQHPPTRILILRICELYDAGIWRRCSRRTLAVVGADDGNERNAAVRLVDCGHFRGAVESDGYQGFSCRQSSEESRSSSERPHLDPEVAVIDNAELDKIIDGPARARPG